MSHHVDLNADLGESFGPWTMGADADLLDIVSSANIACGFHASDPDVMARTMRLAAERGVAIGAHPGFADLQGFGRRRISLPPESLKNLVRYQVAAAQGMARAAGGQLAHVKLHGALSNMAAEDEGLARLLFAAALDIDPDLVVYVLSATPMEAAARSLGCRWAGEVFADRAYNDDATLVDRREPGAVLHDPTAAALRMVEMVQAGAISTASGGTIPARIDTICLHGDTPEAVAMAHAIRSGLEKAGITIGPASERA
ncbi:MAG: LamB/YcsF family protein [Rhodobacteraceae bacterium]|nr:LamB/YcsF family protein [Paracoccaceae bacterium]